MSLSIYDVSPSVHNTGNQGVEFHAPVEGNDTSDSQYEIDYGDTIHSIAKKIGIDQQSLLDANPQVVNPNVLYPRDILQLPQQNNSDSATINFPREARQVTAYDHTATNVQTTGTQTTVEHTHSDTTSHTHDTSTQNTDHDHSKTNTTTTKPTSTGTGALDPTKLPIGDGKYSFDGAKKGYIYLDKSSSNIGPNNPAGSSVNGPWISSNGTYDSTNKVTVQGNVQWPSEAKMSFSNDGKTRTISTNDLPGTSGEFPISSSSEAYKYDKNPNSIKVQNLSVDLPTTPKANSYSTPVSGGAIGFIYADTTKTSMVALYAGVDEKGNDAVAHEVQDSNKGHPQQSGEYHFHSASAALKDAEGVIGYALDGFPIMGSMENGKKVTNADLDENHGKYTTMNVDGKQVKTYAYYATDEYPYTIGAFKGTPSKVQGEIAPGQGGTQPSGGVPPQTGTPQQPSGGTPPQTGMPQQPSGGTPQQPFNGTPQQGSPPQSQPTQESQSPLGALLAMLQTLFGSSQSSRASQPPANAETQSQSQNQVLQSLTKVIEELFSVIQALLGGSQTSNGSNQTASDTNTSPPPRQSPTNVSQPSTGGSPPATGSQPATGSPLLTGSHPTTGSTPPTGLQPPPDGSPPPRDGPPPGSQPQPQGNVQPAPVAT